jgi:hypothetical protein
MILSSFFLSFFEQFTHFTHSTEDLAPYWGCQIWQLDGWLISLAYGALEGSFDVLSGAGGAQPVGGICVHECFVAGRISNIVCNFRQSSLNLVNNFAKVSLYRVSHAVYILLVFEESLPQVNFYNNITK